jgi:hypothetical protein
MMKIKNIFSFSVPILFAFQLIFIVGCNKAIIEPTATSVPLKPTDTSAPLPPSPTHTSLPPTPTHTSPPPSPTHTHTPTFTPTKTFTPLPSPTHTLSPTTEGSSCATMNTMPVLPSKVAELTLINESGFPVLLKLESCGIGRQFYYLTVSQGTKTSPSIETFTILMDYYDRTTFACEGIETKGILIMDRNNKLTFTSCPLSPPTPSITP